MVVVEDDDEDVIMLEQCGLVSSADFSSTSSFFRLGIQVGGSANCELLVESNEKFWHESLSILIL